MSYEHCHDGALWYKIRARGKIRARARARARTGGKVRARARARIYAHRSQLYA